MSRYRISLLSFAFAMFTSGLICFMPQGAYAFGRKLDLNRVQGKYEYVPTRDTSIDCPESITVTYDAAKAELDSEIFHFRHIGRGAQSVPGGQIEGTPDHSSTTQQWVVTSLTSDSVIEQQIDQATSVSPADPRMNEGPMTTPVPGTPESYGVYDSSHEVRTRVLFNIKTGTLKKTVEADGMNTGDNCEYRLLSGAR